jgi:hypothetical protein
MVLFNISPPKNRAFYHSCVLQYLAMKLQSFLKRKFYLLRPLYVETSGQPTSIGRRHMSLDQSYQQDEVQKGGFYSTVVSAQRQWNSTYWRRRKKG